MADLAVDPEIGKVVRVRDVERSRVGLVVTRSALDPEIVRVEPVLERDVAEQDDCRWRRLHGLFW